MSALFVLACLGFASPASAEEMSLLSHLAPGHVADGSIDYSPDFQKAVNTAAAAGSVLVVPAGFTVAARDIRLPSGFTLRVDGTVVMPANSPHGSVLFRNSKPDSGNSRIAIVGPGALDGNKASQVNLPPCISRSADEIRDCGHGLVELRNCSECEFAVTRVRGNFFPRSYPSSETTGAVTFVNSSKAWVHNTIAENYGREAYWLNNCTDCRVEHVKATGGADSWSGLQLSGTRNIANDIISKSAGASGISIDSTYSQVSYLRSYDNRYSHGINFGHEGKPATGTRASRLVSERSVEHGIAVGFGTTNLAISSFYVRSPAKDGLHVSNGAKQVILDRGCIFNAGRVGIGLFEAQLMATNMYFEGVSQPVYGFTSASGIKSTWQLTTSPSCLVTP